MLTPDYQEFAKRAPASIRDNTVIYDLRTSRNGRNPPGVAGLPRQNQHERRTFRPSGGIAAVPRQAVRLPPFLRTVSLGGSRRLGSSRILRPPVDHLVDKPEILGLVGGEEFVA